MKEKEPVTVKVIDSAPTEVAKAIQPYRKEGLVYFGYEAGCMGYTLYRVLTEMKINCQIIAPNKVFRGGNNEKIKTDKHDALAIAWMLRGEVGRYNIIDLREFMTNETPIMEIGGYERIWRKAAIRAII